MAEFLSPEKLDALRKESPEIQGQVLDKYFPTLKNESPEIQKQVHEKYGLMSSSQPNPASNPEPATPEWAGKYPNAYAAAATATNMLSPIVEAGGMVLGGAGGTVGATPGAGTLLGAGLGYAGAKALTSGIKQNLGMEQSKTLPQAASQAVGDVATGAMMEAGGQVGGKIIGKGIEVAGKGIKQVLGASTGAGPGMVEEAVKGGKTFTDAMRGKTTGDEIVDNAASALQSLKEQRAAQYTSKLADISQNREPIDITPIKDKIGRLLNQYGVRPGDVASGEAYDFSRSVFGKSASKDVKEIADMIGQWGSKEGDNTPIMLDTLKRRLDDFYSDSSQARQLVTAIRNEVKTAITRQVPEYSDMTKGYAEATNLIKDIESGLMLRKQGMSGRITGDKTLRRLTSAMKENFEMRKDLVNILGEKSGQDLSSQVAGYSATSIIPRGLVGKLAGGGVGVLGYLNPKFWPLLAATSPRVVGEFLNVYGKGLIQAKVISPATYKTLAFEAGKAWEGSTDEKKKQFLLDNMNKLNPVSEASAAEVLSYGKNRVAQIDAAVGSEASQGRQPMQQAAPASSGPAITAEHANAFLDREIAKIKAEEAKKAQPVKKGVPLIIHEKVISLPNDMGEKLIYIDQFGRTYDDDPTYGGKQI